jgi:hypothetical protein
MDPKRSIPQPTLSGFRQSMVAKCDFASQFGPLLVRPESSASVANSARIVHHLSRFAVVFER